MRNYQQISDCIIIGKFIAQIWAIYDYVQYNTIQISLL